MKQKCEEIIINQYLKGNITDENKNRHLEGLAMLNQDGLKYVYNKLTNNSLQFFEETQMFFETWDQFSETEQKEVFSQAVSDNEVLKLFKEIEELEDELFKQH
jgi:replicative superfamily II helicase